MHPNIIEPVDLIRCAWVAAQKPLTVTYHDLEWGVPVHDDRKHFEMLLLEGAQAGLSWDTILNKREGYRLAFANFDAARVADFSDATLDALMSNPDIIRNRLKISAARRNAQVFLKIQAEFGSFDKYIWSFVGGKTIVNAWKSIREIPPLSQESKSISADLKRRGMTFVGPTIIYSHMQSVGMVNDHTTDCFRYAACCAT